MRGMCMGTMEGTGLGVCAFPVNGTITLELLENNALPSTKYHLAQRIIQHKVTKYHPVQSTRICSVHKKSHGKP